MTGFISISPEFVSSTIAYTGLVFQDFLPLFVVIIGLIIGFFIVRMIISMTREIETIRREREALEEELEEEEEEFESIFGEPFEE